MEFPSRQIKRQQNLLNVADVSWLRAHAHKHTRTSKRIHVHAHVPSFFVICLINIRTRTQPRICTHMYIWSYLFNVCTCTDILMFLFSLVQTALAEQGWLPVRACGPRLQGEEDPAVQLLWVLPHPREGHPCWGMCVVYVWMTSIKTLAPACVCVGWCWSVITSLYSGIISLFACACVWTVLCVCIMMPMVCCDALFFYFFLVFSHFSFELQQHLELKEAVTAFEWEPNGNRFAVLTNETARPDVQFYQLKGKSLQHLSKCVCPCVCCVRVRVCVCVCVCKWLVCVYVCLSLCFLQALYEPPANAVRLVCACVCVCTVLGLLYVLVNVL